ncbi:MAG: response regulator [Gemmatimonadaceae bacterium]
MGLADRVRVLVVDDESTICRALSIAMTRAGYEVVATGSGERAHVLLTEQHFDCMIVDLRMPDMRGDELFELAASIQPHLRRQTLFTTGDASERAQELIDACGCPVIPKPFDLSELLAAVGKLTRRLRDATA